MNELINPNFQTERQQAKSFGFWLSILFFLIAFTQLIRIIIIKYDFANFLNDKFAFSLDVPVVAMYLVYVLVMAAILIFLKKQWHLISEIKKLGFVLIIAGGLANMLERILFGHVLDYIFLLSGVLNIADFFIIIGALLVVIDKDILKKK